ncbi:tetratricopeptide repeat protein [bacterium]|nr:tetratricopeptide repeat protein [bacterium]
MPIRPKHTISGGEGSAARQRKFTDREEFIATFREHFAAKPREENRILSYYGVGGIGKTTLRKELGRILDDKYPNTLWTILDFDTPTHRDEETALFWLRKSFFRKYKIGFPSFEIAYGFLWQKTRPQIPLTKDNCSLIDEGGLLSDVLDVAGDVPGIDIISAGVRAIVQGQKHIRDWWKKRGQSEIYKLTDMEPREILERLPMYWASDFKDFINSRGLSSVMFLDTYEAMWEGERAEAKVFTRDEWVRELVAQLPEVLWVICGREKLRWGETDPDWDQVIDQRLVGKLSEKDVNFFLESCGISNAQIKQTINEASKGLPYYLDLAVDTYYQIRDKHSQEPQSEDFAGTPRKVLDRFLRYLDRGEIETLKVLSSLRFFDYEIFEKLVDHFKTGYPITAFEELLRFSFIYKWDQEGTWAMHELMRSALQEFQPDDLKARVLEFVFEYYSAKLVGLKIRDVTEQHCDYLTEAYFYGKIIIQEDRFFKWFFTVGRVFSEAARWRVLLPLYEEAVGILEDSRGPGQVNLAFALNNLADLYHHTGKFSESETLYMRALEIFKKQLGEDKTEVALVLEGISNLYESLGKFKEAVPLSQRALEIRENELGGEHPEVANSLINLAKHHFALGRHSEAEPLFERALRIREKNLEPEHPDIAEALNDLGWLYYSEGQYDKAETASRKALEIWETNYGTEHPRVTMALNNLAIIYRKLGKHEEAEPLYKRALEVREKILGSEHPDVAQSLNNIGLLYQEQKRFDEAIEIYNRVLEINRKAFGEEHINIAMTLNNLGLAHTALEQFDRAVSHYKQAIRLFEKLLGSEHPQVAFLLNNLARVYSKAGEFKEVESLYQRAIEIFEKNFGPEHPDLGNIMSNLANFYQGQGEQNKAIDTYEKVLEIWEKVFEPDSKRLVRTREKLENIRQELGDSNAKL